MQQGVWRQQVVKQLASRLVLNPRLILGLFVSGLKLSLPGKAPKQLDSRQHQFADARQELLKIPAELLQWAARHAPPRERDPNRPSLKEDMIRALELLQEDRRVEAALDAISSLALASQVAAPGTSATPAGEGDHSSRSGVRQGAVRPARWRAWLRGVRRSRRDPSP